ncbi:MAG: family 20 glycosylhydrolase [Ignavibacteriae bacterium]|nr:family 20 glycosylhydrolase [Ignavibacteriota bacterium]
MQIFLNGKRAALLCIVALSWTILAARQTEPTHSLMPVPAQVRFTNGTFRLTESFTIVIRRTSTSRLEAGMQRALQRLAGRTGLFFSRPAVSQNQNADKPALSVMVKQPGEVKLGEDESYTLTVDARGILLAAQTDIGALRGVETLLQLLSADKDGYYFPCVRIVDEPRFPWRGLMIDAARHFMPVDVIKRNLDGMAAVKLNVLHWHLSDDQGFRVESIVYPKLHERGSDGMYYTQAQIREIVEYADERGIRVVPEFDVPGHTTALVYAYPELGSGPPPDGIERKWGVFDPVLNPANESTYEFLDRFIGEMATLFPDPYFHIGGDEVEHGGKVKHWDTNPEIQSFMKRNELENNKDLQRYFNERLLPIVKKHKRIMIGWDEILQDNMPKDIVIQSWRGRESMMQAARQGFQSILSSRYYIDLIQPTDYHYLNDSIPPDANFPPELQKMVLGGETTMWAEFVSWETVDSRIWPRTAAIAERFWSPQNVRDIDDMYRRLNVISLQLEEHGLTHEKNYEMMLRRLVNGNDVSALKTLVDVIEPVKGYNRNNLREHTSLSPLTRVIDAARPDARVARNFRTVVDRLLTNTPLDLQILAELRTQLTVWEQNHAVFEQLAERSPALREVLQLSDDLSAVARIGLAALSLVENEKQETDEWGKEQLELIKLARAPRGQVELMVLSAIEKLVYAASEVQPSGTKNK